MKNIKICALALSAGFMLCSTAGCFKKDVPPVSSSLAVTTKASSETTAAPSESGESSAAGSESSLGSIELDAERQEYANGFITTFARQYISRFNASNAGIEQYADFAHIYFIINGYRQISTQKKGDLSFEVFSFAEANGIVAKYFGVLLKEEDCKKLPAPPSTYGDQPAGPFYEDGKFWYEAAGGETYNILAVVDSCKNNGDGTQTLYFTVYMVDSEDYSKDEVFKKYLKLTSSEAKKDKTLKKSATGTATVDIAESGDYLMKYYRSNNV